MPTTVEEQLEGILSREGSESDSLVIPNHLAQMKLFGMRQGVELLPFQDPTKVRKPFIDKLYKDNQIDLNLDRFWDLMLCKGQLLFYLRPTGNSYRIYHYNKDQFKAYYDGEGQLLKVVIVYDFEVESPAYFPQRRWIKLQVEKQKIYRYESDVALSVNGIDQQGLRPVSVEDNTLGVVSCVVVNNYVVAPGHQGKNEFEHLKSQLEAHDRMLCSIKENIQFFGNPTLISSRSLAELTEAGFEGGGTPRRPTVSSASGFYSAMTSASGGGSVPSTFSSRKSMAQAPAVDALWRVRRVVGNVGGDERFGYITPDPVTPDHSRYAQEYRDDLHSALGGVDPASVRASATAFEVKSLFGRAAATAFKKAKHLYTYGLCKVFELAIQAEEWLAKCSLADLINQLSPPKLDENGLPISPWTAIMISDDMFTQAMQTGTLPTGKKIPPNYLFVGLPPMGDRTVNWRWLGPVFEDSPQDTLQKSIVVRNLEELGVDTIKALEHLFPEKTEAERTTMLTGYPFREMNENSSALQQQLGILNQMLQTIDPTTGQPIAFTMNNISIIQATLNHLNKRLSYGLSASPADSGNAFNPGGTSATPDGPDGVSASASSNAGTVLPGNAAYSPMAGYASNPITTPAAAAGLPGVALNNGGANQSDPRSGFTPESSRPLPIPGGVVATQLWDVYQSASAGVYGGTPMGGTGIPADLANSPGILQSIYGPASSPASTSRPANDRAGAKPKEPKRPKQS